MTETAKHHTVTLHAAPHHNSLHVGEHELTVVDGKVDVPAHHVEEAKAHGFSETPHEHIKAKTAEERMVTLERRIADLEGRLASLEAPSQATENPTRSGKNKVS